MGNSEEIFEGFFGSTDPLATDFEIDGSDVYGSLLGDAHGAKFKLRPEPPVDVELDLKCSLLELYNGSMKTVKYTCDKTHWNNRTIMKEEQEIKIEVKPGYSVGDVLTYQGRGNMQYTYPRAALKIKLCDDTSCKTNYVRKGNDLIYTHSMSLQEALAQKPIQICTLDNRILNLNLDIAITPQAVHLIPGEGMPIEIEKQKDGCTNGDLYVKFDIQFPVGIADDKRAKIVEILKKNAEETMEDDE